MLADRPEQVAGQRARAGAGLDHPGSGEDVGLDQDPGGVLGVDHGRTPRHGHGELVQQRPQRQERACRPTEVTTTPSGPAIRSSCATAPLVVWNSPPAASTIECRRPLGSVRVIRSPACERSPADAGGRAGRRQPPLMPHSPSCQPGPKEVGAHLDPGPGVEVLVGLADRQHDQVHRGSAAAARPAAGRPRSGSVVPRNCGLQRAHRRRRRRAAVRPGRAAARPAPWPSTPCGPPGCRSAPGLAGRELDAEPAGVLQPGPDLDGDVLAVRGGRVVAEGQVDPALPGHLGRRLAAQREARRRGPRTPAGTRESEVRSPCRASAMAVRSGLLRRARDVGRPLQLQHAYAGQHGLAVAAVGLLAPGCAAPAGCSRVIAAASSPRHTTSTVPLVIASSMVAESATVR